MLQFLLGVALLQEKNQQQRGVMTQSYCYDYLQQVPKRLLYHPLD